MTQAMKTIRVGIIGQGRSGHDIHARTIVKFVPERFTVVAVADPRPGQLVSDLLAKDVARLADYRQLFRRTDIDLIVNASPSNLHVPISLEALESGFNVLCEKPVARTAAEVDRLIETARRKGKLFAIFQQSRFGPYFQKIREVIASGVLGRIVLIKTAWNGFARRWDWQTVQEMNGGSLRNTGPHPLDQALCLFGFDAMPRVACVLDRATTLGDAEDTVKLILSGPGRPTIDLEICSCSAYNSHTYVVNGTHGSLAGSTEHLEWKYFKPDEAPRQSVTLEPLPGRTWCAEDLKWHTGSWDLPKEEGAGIFDVMARAFYRGLHDSLVDGKPLVVQPVEVRRQIAVMEECFRQNPLPPH
jgi:predicted dehydrogenase